MSDCIFCKIIKGEIPSNTVYENDNFKVILDVSPANLGHCLVLPKNHSEDIFEIEEDVLKGAFAIAKKIATALKASGLAEGVNILQNNKEVAGQTVHHFHIHVIPRKTGDNVKIEHNPIKPSAEEVNEVKEKLFKILN